MPATTRHTRARSGWIVIGSAAAVALLGLGAWSLLPHAEEAPRVFGSGMAIALVAPREPTPVEGSILEVGDLNDGFDRAALDRQPEPTVLDYLPPEAYVGEAPTLDLPYDRDPPLAEPVVVADTAPARDPLADGSRWFGFDRQRAAGSIPAASRPAVVAEASSPAAGEPAQRSETFFQ